MSRNVIVLGVIIIVLVAIFIGIRTCAKSPSSETTKTNEASAAAAPKSDMITLAMLKDTKTESTPFLTTEEQERAADYKATFEELRKRPSKAEMSWRDREEGVPPETAMYCAAWGYLNDLTTFRSTLRNEENPSVIIAAEIPVSALHDLQAKIVGQFWWASANAAATGRVVRCTNGAPSGAGLTLIQRAKEVVIANDLNPETDLKIKPEDMRASRFMAIQREMPDLKAKAVAGDIEAKEQIQSLLEKSYFTPEQLGLNADELAKIRE